MPVVNYASREITCKIVYYGPGRSGKTSNLQYIHRRAPAERRGEMMSLATHGDRTLFFDFLPLDLGTISGFTTRFQLYTVPGQVYYRSTRRLVLQGADGVVFVADSQRRQMDENVDSYRDLHEALAEHGINAREVPLVLQYNKQDLPAGAGVPAGGTRSTPELPQRPELSAPMRLAATGVFETLRRASELVLRRLPVPATGGASGMIDGRFRFETFITGPSNRLAVSAARAVAEAPGKVYHPLFLYAESGLGKTHLLAAIGSPRARRSIRHLTVEYRAAEDYAEQLRSGVRARRPECLATRVGVHRASSCSTTCSSSTASDEAQAELLRLIDQAQGRGLPGGARERPPARRTRCARPAPAVAHVGWTHRRHRGAGDRDPAAGSFACGA